MKKKAFPERRIQLSRSKKIEREIREAQKKNQIEAQQRKLSETLCQLI